MTKDLRSLPSSHYPSQRDLQVKTSLVTFDGHFTIDAASEAVELASYGPPGLALLKLLHLTCRSARGCSTSGSTARNSDGANTIFLYMNSTMRFGKQQLRSGDCLGLLGRRKGDRRIITNFMFPDMDCTANSSILRSCSRKA